MSAMNVAVAGAGNAAARRSTHQLIEQNRELAHCLAEQAKRILFRIELPLQPSTKPERPANIARTINAILDETQCDLVLLEKLLTEIVATLGEPKLDVGSAGVLSR